MKRKTFIDYLNETLDETRGTYASLKLCDKNSEKLHSFMHTLNIKNLSSMDDYHCTIVYSKKFVPEIEGIKPKLPINAVGTEWDILGDCLVIKLKSFEIVKLNSTCMEFGATSDYDEYIPHITVATDFFGEIPKTLPKMKFNFDEFVVEVLDEDV
jgi:hypothetical protein